MLERDRKRLQRRSHGGLSAVSQYHEALLSSYHTASMLLPSGSSTKAA
jgi:hypothetical protein